MDHKTLTEIATIEAWIEALKEYPANTGRVALTVVTEAFVGVSGANASEGLLELARLVNSLPSLAAEIPRGGQRTVADRVVQRIRRILDPELLGEDFKAYRSKRNSDFDYIIDSLAIFHDLTFDSGALAVALPSLFEAIDDMKSRFAQSNDISDASRSVLSAQLDLLRNSLQRFQTTGVGQFRDSMFSIVGRVRIQLDLDHVASAEKKTEIIDNILRIYGMAQAGGDLLKLSGKAAQLFLTGPTT